MTYGETIKELKELTCMHLIAEMGIQKVTYVALEYVLKVASLLWDPAPLDATGARRASNRSATTSISTIVGFPHRQRSTKWRLQRLLAFPALRPSPKTNCRQSQPARSNRSCSAASTTMRRGEYGQAQRPKTWQRDLHW